jgi:hypothetical protein
MILVTSARLLEGIAHDRVRIWNRGGLAGELVLRSGDGRLLLTRLGCVSTHQFYEAWEIWAPLDPDSEALRRRPDQEAKAR